MLFGTGVVGFVIAVIIICAVYFLLCWLIRSAPFIPDGVKSIACWVILALCILWFVDVIMGLGGYSFGSGHLGHL
jgi:hypothetical protein